MNIDSLRRLEEIFSHFPGIGPRQAKRFVHYIQGKSPASIKEFVGLIEEVRKATIECSRCHRFFVITENGAGKSAANIKLGGKVCSICSDSNRDETTLMIVARDSDFETVEKSGAYKGLYFILGGTVPILDKEPDKRIRLKVLLEHVAGMGKISNNKNGRNELAEGDGIAVAGDPQSDPKTAQNLVKNVNELGVREIILSLNTTPDGEHTATIVKEAIQKIAPKTKITILGRGLSTGAELEYADSETIKNALSNRK